MVSATTIDSYLWSVRTWLWKKCGSVDDGNRAVYPLVWYIDTGRASGEFLRLLLSHKPYVVGQSLMGGGSDEEAISRVKSRIGCK